MVADVTPVSGDELVRIVRRVCDAADCRPIAFPTWENADGQIRYHVTLATRRFSRDFMFTNEFLEDQGEDALVAYLVKTMKQQEEHGTNTDSH
jgi:hypothetical protein